MGFNQSHVRHRELSSQARGKLVQSLPHETVSTSRFLLLMQTLSQKLIVEIPFLFSQICGYILSQICNLLSPCLYTFFSAVQFLFSACVSSTNAHFISGIEKHPLTFFIPLDVVRVFMCCRLHQVSTSRCLGELGGEEWTTGASLSSWWMRR